jgi:thiol-disulfide isomerase/thioredoxin
MKRTQYFASLLLAAAIVLSLASCSSEQKEATRTQVAAGMNADTPKPKVLNINNVKSNGKNKAADFSWTDNGKTYKFSEYTKGKVVFLNFWGTWCGPCQREIPDIIQIGNELKNKDFVIIGMGCERTNLTNEQQISNIEKFAAKAGINYINFVANSDIKELYGGILSIPQTFIIDKQGNIVETLVGMRNKEQFMTSINRVL